MKTDIFELQRQLIDKLSDKDLDEAKQKAKSIWNDDALTRRQLKFIATWLLIEP